MGLCYLNGDYLPLQQAKISVLDRGFLFGDAVYEVIPAYGGHPLRLAHHLTRLDNSLAAIRMRNPLSHDDWTTIIQRLAEQHPGQDQSIYLQISRGPTDGRDHRIPEQPSPTCFAMGSLIGPAPDYRASGGVRAITLDDIRWHLCQIKSTSLLAHVLLKAEAADANAYEAILIRDEQATEGAASNLFIVRDGQIVTPPDGPQLLPGITRDLVVELAGQHGLPCELRPIAAGELAEADEIWLTSSTREVMPVTELNGRPVANGRPGPIWEEIDRHYQACKQQLRQRASDDCPPEAT